MALEAAGVEPEDVRGWAAGRAEIAARLRPHCARRDARERALAYIRALLSPAERKPAWQLAESAGDSTPSGLQHLLGRAAWDHDAVRDGLRGYVLAQLGDPEGLLVLDETSFPKTGTKSVGVARQSGGRRGKREHCQVGVLLAYASAQGRAFIDRERSLPKDGTQAPERVREAGAPDGVPVRTTPEIGRRMLQRALGALDAGVKATWVTGDEVYGGDFKLSACLEERQQPYVLGVAANQDGWVGFYQLRVDALIGGLPEDAWQRLSCGEGATGPRVDDGAARGLNGVGEGWERWALARRSVADPEAVASYLVFVPAGTALEEVVRAAGRRWTIAETLEEATGEGGLAHYEVRRWRGWYRHIPLALLAHASLAVTRASATSEATKGGMDEPTGRSSLAGFKRRRGL